MRLVPSASIIGRDNGGMVYWIVCPYAGVVHLCGACWGRDGQRFFYYLDQNYVGPVQLQFVPERYKIQI